MATNLTALFETKYDGSGIAQAKGGFGQWTDEVKKANTATESVGANYEKLATRVGKPIPKVAYKSIAADVLVMSGAMDGASGAASGLSRVFMSVGSALMYVQPMVSLTAIALVGLIAVYNKVSKASSNSVENIKAKTTAMLQDAEAAKKAAESLKELGSINEKQYTQLKSIGAQKERDVIALQKELALKKQMKDAEVDALQLQVKSGVEGGKGASIRLDLHKALKEQAVLEKALIAIGETSVGVAQQQNDRAKERAELLAKQQVILAIHAANEMNLQQAVQALADTEDRKNTLENQFIDTTSPKKAAAIEAEINNLNLLGQAYSGQIAKLQAAARAEQTVLQQRAAIFNRYTMAVENSWEMHGKKLVFNARKFLAEELKIIADQAATALAIASVKYFASGNFAMGAVAAAGAITVRALAGAGAALLGGETGGEVSTPETSTGSSLSSGVGSTATGTPLDTRQMAINVYVEGHILGGEKALGDALIDIINDRVVRDGKTLVTTRIHDTGATVPL